MTINATAAWLLGLYVAHAEEMGVDPARSRAPRRTTSSRSTSAAGTYIFPPGPSLRLTVDTIAYTVRNAPKWNPINVCSYHLQEAGATPVQEIAYALATAIGVLDARRGLGQDRPDGELPAVVGRISFFVNSGVRFVEETCKMRAFTEMWDRICAERYGVEDPKLRRFRYGVQVNSLSLTEQQPENNVQRIVLETLGRDPVEGGPGPRHAAAGLERGARACPGPGTSSGRCASSRCSPSSPTCSSTATSSTGSVVIGAKTAELAEAARAELEDVLALGGAFEAIDELKRRLVGSQAERVRRIETGELKVVGVNCFTETAEPSPLLGDGEIENILRVDPAVEAELEPTWTWSAGGRDATRGAVRAPSTSCAGRRRREPRGNIMPATIALAHAGGTTGEWAGALREVFGEYRAPTGVGGGVGRRGEEFAGRAACAPGPWPSARAARRACSWPSPGSTGTPTAPSRSPWRPATPGSR